MILHNNTAAFTAITQQLNHGATYLRHTPMQGGVSAQIFLLEYVVPAGNQHRVVVRCHSSAAWKSQNNVTEVEYHLQSALHAAGLQVARPLYLDVSGTLLPVPFFVMEYIEGTADISPARLPGALSQMADFLCTLHQLDFNGSDYPGLSDDDDPLAGALRYIPDQPANTQLREQLQLWRLTPASQQLLHGDYWPGNLLWKDSQLAAVIDWEDASLGPALSDLAGCRSELMVMYGEAAMHTFTQHYLAHHALDLTDLPVWELYAGYAALDSLADWGLPAAVEKHRRQRTRQFLSRAAADLLSRALSKS